MQYMVNIGQVCDNCVLSICYVASYCHLEHFLQKSSNGQINTHTAVELTPEVDWHRRLASCTKVWNKKGVKSEPDALFGQLLRNLAGVPSHHHRN